MTSSVWSLLQGPVKLLRVNVIKGCLEGCGDKVGCVRDKLAAPLLLVPVEERRELPLHKERSDLVLLTRLIVVVSLHHSLGVYVADDLEVAERCNAVASRKPACNYIAEATLPKHLKHAISGVPGGSLWWSRRCCCNWRCPS